MRSSNVDLYWISIINVVLWKRDGNDTEDTTQLLTMTKKINTATAFIYNTIPESKAVSE